MQQRLEPQLDTWAARPPAAIHPGCPCMQPTTPSSPPLRTHQHLLVVHDQAHDCSGCLPCVLVGVKVPDIDAANAVPHGRAVALWHVGVAAQREAARRSAEVRQGVKRGQWRPAHLYHKTRAPLTTTMRQARHQAAEQGGPVPTAHLYSTANTSSSPRMCAEREQPSGTSRTP